MSTRIIQLVISVVASGIAVIHVVAPQLTIDAITVTLLGIAVVPWLAPLFKALELPGGIKVEFQELERARREVEKSGLLDRRAVLKPMQEHVYAFQSVVGKDTNLALAGLRIEIESRLRAMAKGRRIPADNLGIGQLTRRLEDAAILSHDEASSIRDLLPLLNRAAHGANVDPAGFDWAMDFGPQILGALEDRLGESSIPTLLESWEKRDGAAHSEVGSQLSKAFVNAPESFLAAMEQRPEAFRSWLETLETNTFTTYQSQGEIEDELYLAYYGKLRELMIRAAQSVAGSKHSKTAQAVETAVKAANVRRIW